MASTLPVLVPTVPLSRILQRRFVHTGNAWQPPPLPALLVRFDSDANDVHYDNVLDVIVHDAAMSRGRVIMLDLSTWKHECDVDYDHVMVYIDHGVDIVVLSALQWEMLVQNMAKESKVPPANRIMIRFQKLEEVEKLTEKPYAHLHSWEIVLAMVSEQLLAQFEARMPERAAKLRFLVLPSNGDDDDTWSSADAAASLASVGRSLVIDSAASDVSAANIIISLIKSDRADGLYATVVVDEAGVALGLVYSSKESIRASFDKRKGIYHSRSRQSLWEKGLTSGAHQDLLCIDFDCDADALRYTVHQHGTGFCHLNRRTCWSEDKGIGHLFRTLFDRKLNPIQNSYTNRLFNDSQLLASKLKEEAQELLDAQQKEEIAWEAADLIYFASVLCVRSDVNWADIEAMLDARSKRVRRRPGNAKLNAEIKS